MGFKNPALRDHRSCFKQHWPSNSHGPCTNGPSTVLSKAGLGTGQPQGWIQVPPLTSCISLNKLLKLYNFSFLMWKMENNHNKIVNINWSLTVTLETLQEINIIPFPQMTKFRFRKVKKLDGWSWDLSLNQLNSKDWSL